MSKIIGTSDLIRKLKAIGGSAADDAMEKTVRKWTEYVRGEAAGLCPVDTGELRQSIRTDVEHDGDEVRGIVYTNKEYAPCVEFGTGKRGAATSSGTSPDIDISYAQSINGQPAQPFMYPALANNRARITRGMREDLRKAIKGAAK